MLRARLGPAADLPLSYLAWGATRRPRGAPRPHLCLVSHLASRSPCSTFLLRSYTYGSAEREGAAEPGASGVEALAEGARLAGDCGLSLVDSLRATSAAPWYLEEVSVHKELITGEVFGIGRKPPEGTHAVQLRLIDGGITCNNPADVAIHESKLLFGRERPLLVVSVGTGSGVAAEVTPSAIAPLWLQHLVNATGDVAQTDATVRHLLSPTDFYIRFNPTLTDSYGLDDARESTLAELTRAAEAYMDDHAAELQSLAARLSELAV